MKNNVLVLGGTCYCTVVYLDELPEPKTQSIRSIGAHVTLGQMGTGKSLNLKHLGFNTTLQAYIGNDEYGKRIIDFFSDKNINFSYDYDSAGTENHINIMDSHGERISITTCKTSFEPVINYEKMENLIKNSDYIALNIYNYNRHLIPLIKKYTKEIWCDLGDYEPDNKYFDDFANAADYITMSSIYLKDYKSVMKRFLDAGKKMVVCTHGNKGATHLTKEGKYIDTPIIDDYKLVDANGAGDSFFSALMYAYSQGFSMEKSMKVATIVAGLCISSNELCHPELSIDLVKREYKRIYNEDL